MPDGVSLVFVKQIGTNNPIWKPFYANYPFFHKWFLKIQNEGRTAWTYGNPVQAVCVFKLEHNPIVNDWGEELKGKVLKLCSFYVDERSQGKGIGKLLLHTALDYAKNEKCRFVYLHSNNSQTQEFFKRFGFVPFAGAHSIEGRESPDMIQVRSVKL